MFEFDELDEIEEMQEWYNDNTNATKTDDSWRQGKSDFDIADEIADLAGCAIPEAGPAIRR